MDKIKAHETLCDSLHNTYISKNNAYGDSFGKSYEQWGVASAAVRISDKFNRFVNLATHPDINTGDESIKDTLLDMANYCLMTIIELNNEKYKREMTNE